MSSKDTRFGKGQSGNPKGRPKSSKNFASDFMREANETVAVTVNGRRKYMSIARAGIKQLMSKAAAGDLPAIKQVLDRIEILEARAAQQKPAHDVVTFSDKDREVIDYVSSMFTTAND